MKPDPETGLCTIFMGGILLIVVAVIMLAIWLGGVAW